MHMRMGDSQHAVLVGGGGGRHLVGGPGSRYVPRSCSRWRPHAAALKLTRPLSLQPQPPVAAQIRHASVTAGRQYRHGMKQCDQVVVTCWLLSMFTSIRQVDTSASAAIEQA